MDNDEIEYHVVGIGGAEISVSFFNCHSASSMELKFNQLVEDNSIQILGTNPMKRNVN